MSSYPVINIEHAIVELDLKPGMQLDLYVGHTSDSDHFVKLHVTADGKLVIAATEEVDIIKREWKGHLSHVEFMDRYHEDLEEQMEECTACAYDLHEGTTPQGDTNISKE